MRRSLSGLETTFRRELATVFRTPGYGVLAGGVLALIAGIAAVGGGGATGFVPAIVDLLLPTEVVVPLVAFVLGYRALLTDTESGEFAVIRTYPVGVGGYVLGVLLARVVGLLVVLGVPYAVVGVGIWLTAAPDTGIFATHAGVDSPWLYVRFLAFVVPFATTYLALATAVSAVTSSRRAAIALGAFAVVVGVLGGDLAAVGSLAGGTSPEAIAGLLARTPNGAFRGLVFEHVVGVAFAPDGGFVATGRALAALAGWTALPVAVSAVALAYGRRLDALFERLRASRRA